MNADLGKAPKVKRAYTDQIPVHTSAERQTSSGVAHLARSFVCPRRADRRIRTGERRHERQSARSAADKDRARQARHGAGRNYSPGCAAARAFDPVFGGGEPGEAHKSRTAAQRRIYIGTRGTWPARARGGAARRRLRPSGEHAPGGRGTTDNRHGANEPRRTKSGECMAHSPSN